MRRAFRGNAAAPGMALGRVRLEQPARFSIDTTPLPDAEADAEVAAQERAGAAAALEAAQAALAEVRARDS